MSAEIDFYNYRIKEDDPVDSLIVPPGHIETSNFFGDDIRLLTSCDITSGTSTVTLLGHDIEKKISAIVYEDEEDVKGEEVLLERGQITIMHPQELSLSLVEGKDRKHVKAMTVYLWSEDDGLGDDFIPDDSLELVLV